MSYARVSTLDEESNVASSSPMIMSSNLSESLPASAGHRFSTSFPHIPVAARLCWSDDFYQGKHGIVAVFDRDAAQAGNFQFWVFIRIVCLMLGIAFMNYLMGILVMKTEQNEQLAFLDDIEAGYFFLIALLFAGMAYRADLQQKQQHVAITMEGIRIDQGTAMTIIIPFENIHSCQAELSAKYLCNVLERPGLSQIRIVRTLSPLEQVCFRKTKQFELYGILHAEAFVDLVIAMQESQEHGTYEGGTEMVASCRPEPAEVETQAQPQQPQVLYDTEVVTAI